MYKIDLLKHLPSMYVTINPIVPEECYIIEITCTSFGKLTILRDRLKESNNEFTFSGMAVKHWYDKNFNLKRNTRGLFSMEMLENMLKKERRLRFPNTITVVYTIRPKIDNLYLFREKVIKLICSWCLSENVYLYKYEYKLNMGKSGTYKHSLNVVSCNDIDMSFSSYPTWEMTDTVNYNE